MSYGVWRKRGKGWSSIEIDSPHNGPLGGEITHMKYNHQLRHLFRKANILCGWDDNLDERRWYANIVINHPLWKVVREDLGDHVKWTAYDPSCAPSTIKLNFRG